MCNRFRPHNPSFRIDFPRLVGTASAGIRARL